MNRLPSYDCFSFIIQTAAVSLMFKVSRHHETNESKHSTRYNGRDRATRPPSLRSTQDDISVQQLHALIEVQAHTITQWTKATETQCGFQDRRSSQINKFCSVLEIVKYANNNNCTASNMQRSQGTNVLAIKSKWCFFFLFFFYSRLKRVKKKKERVMKHT